MEGLLTTGEAAEYLGISRQAIHIATNSKRLAFSRKSVWSKGWKYFNKEDLDSYRANKYNRVITTIINGEKVFQGDNMTLGNAAKYLNITYDNMYYLLTSGKVRYRRKGHCYVIDIKDLDEYKGNKVKKMEKYAI